MLSIQKAIFIKTKIHVHTPINHDDVLIQLYNSSLQDIHFCTYLPIVFKLKTNLSSEIFFLIYVKIFLKI